MFDGLFDPKPKRGPFTIVAVCTGNVCRSPLVEALLNQRLAKSGVHVTSAGTHALVGSPMVAKNQEIASRVGIEGTFTHRARQIGAETLRDADLIIALSREHRRFIVELAPGTSNRAFTLLELARIISHSPAEVHDRSSSNVDPSQAMREAIGVLAQNRGTLAPASNIADYDVVDPYLRDESVYEQSASQIIPAVDSVVECFSNLRQSC